MVRVGRTSSKSNFAALLFAATCLAIDRQKRSTQTAFSGSDYY